MSGRRIPSSRRKAGRSADNLKLQGKAAQRARRFLGISLSGGKADKACVAVLDFYPDQSRLFLSRIFEKIRTEEFVSADLKIHDFISQFQDEIEIVAFDAPMTLPKCMRCKLKCPGYEVCTEPEMIWMRELYTEVNKKKKPKKLFTPYTQRCAEAYLNHVVDESGDIQNGLGANLAPLAARAHFISRRLSHACIEVYPKLTVWRLGLELKVPKSNLRSHRHSVGGDESRRIFLEHLSGRKSVFFYQQDIKAMIENNHAFEAFICAYTAYLNHSRIHFQKTRLGSIFQRPRRTFKFYLPRIGSFFILKLG